VAVGKLRCPLARNAARRWPEKLSAAGFTYTGGGRGGPGGNIGIIMEELKTAK
jgi:hypothetical protein